MVANEHNGTMLEACGATWYHVICGERNQVVRSRVWWGVRCGLVHARVWMGGFVGEVWAVCQGEVITSYIAIAWY